MRYVLSLCLLLYGCSDTHSTPATKPGNVTATPAIHVRVVGHGKPMLLIPGLACSGDVWRGAERRFADKWQLHIVTLAGFAGTSPIEAPVLESARAEILRYIETQKLETPVLLGHSLGAMLVFWVAGSAPDKVGPVIALDGAPFGPALADSEATPERMRPRAALLRSRVTAVTDEQAQGQARLMFGPMVTSPEDLDWLMSTVIKSDRATVGQAMYELMTTDIRAQAARIKTAVLLLVAGDHFANEPSPDLSAYEAQLAPIADHRITLVPHARHFVMLDEPDFVYGQIARFLAMKTP